MKLTKICRICRLVTGQCGILRHSTKFHGNGQIPLLGSKFRVRRKLLFLVIWHYDNDNPTSDTKWLWCIYGCVYLISVHHYSDNESMFVSINCSLTGVWYKTKNSLFHRYKSPTSPSVILFLVSHDSLWTMMCAAIVSYYDSCKYCIITYN